MFESFTEKQQGRTSRLSKTLIGSLFLHGLALAFILFFDHLRVQAVAQPPVMITFVDFASLPPPPPPPPPPKKRSKPKTEKKVDPKIQPKIREFVAPKEIPQEKAREPEEPEEGPDDGVEGGVEGGVVGGVVGGVIGGMMDTRPPPPRSASPAPPAGQADLPGAGHRQEASGWRQRADLSAHRPGRGPRGHHHRQNIHHARRQGGRDEISKNRQAL